MSGSHRSAASRRLVTAGLAGVLLGIGGTFAGVGLSHAAQPDQAQRDRSPTTPVASSKLADAKLADAKAADEATAAVKADCGRAVRQADASLQEAIRVEKSLAEHIGVMNQLSAGKITPGQALNMGMPSLISGAHHSAMFDRAYADYRSVVTRCQLR